MTIGEAFHTTAISDTEITSYVGTRIYPSSVPQRGMMPTAMYRILPGVQRATHDGINRWSEGGRLEVTVWSARNEEAERAIAAFISKFGDFRGKLGGEVDVRIHGVVGPRYLYDTQSQYFGQQVDFIWNVDLLTVS